VSLDCPHDLWQEIPVDDGFRVPGVEGLESSMSVRPQRHLCHEASSQSDNDVALAESSRGTGVIRNFVVIVRAT